MTAVRSQPCSACPYRLDAPSGLWMADEYAKLPPYDAPTGDQPFQTFACHATPDHHCHGWAVVHSSRGHEYELMALRVRPPEGGIPESGVPMFASGTEAAEHGLRDVDAPSPAAEAAGSRLLRKYDHILGADTVDADATVRPMREPR